MRDDTGVERVALARAAAGTDGGRLEAWASEQIANAFGMMTTESIERVRGVLDVGGDRHAFSLIAKTVRPARHFPPFAGLPPETIAAIEATLPWRIEPEVYASGLHDVLPQELAAPRLYALEELAEDRARMWLEDIGATEAGWDLSTYAAAASALGRLAGRFPEDDIPWRFTRMRLDPGYYLDSRIAGGAMPVLRADETWQHPLVRDAVDPDLRADTLHLWDRIDGLLERAGDVPRTLAHGDACPQNLFVRQWATGTRFVAIDWGMTGIGPVGTDLVQLVAGRAESGELDPADVPAIEDAILPAYLEGLTTEGVDVDPERLALAYRTWLLARCAFTALPVERLPYVSPDDPAARELFARRARWARFLVDVGQALAGAVE